MGAFVHTIRETIPLGMETLAHWTIVEAWSCIQELSRDFCAIVGGRYNPIVDWFWVCDLFLRFICMIEVWLFDRERCQVGEILEGGW